MIKNYTDIMHNNYRNNNKPSLGSKMISFRDNISKLKEMILLEDNVISLLRDSIII